MALLLKCGAIFLHIPKTGGSWVERMLYEQDLVEKQIGHKHATVERVIYPHTFREAVHFLLSALPRRLAHHGNFDPPPFMFSFVRNPLSWYESWWKFNMKQGWPTWGDPRDPNHWHPNADLADLEPSDFNTYMKQIIHTHPGYVTTLYHAYTGPYVQFVGHQETLAQDLVKVLRILNVHFDEDRILASDKVNVSGNRHQIKWDPAIRHKVLELEAAAMARFGYDGLST